MNTDNQLKNHILFTEHSAIKEICAPILQPNIDSFAFVRMFPDGRFITACTALEWAEFGFNRITSGFYPDNALINRFITSGIRLSSHNLDNILIQEAMSLFNFNSGIVIADPNEDYIDNFHYFSKEAHFKKEQFYLSNINLLEKFNHYFTEKADGIIKKNLTNKLTVPQKYLQAITKTKADSLCSLEFSKHLETRQFHELPSLSVREKQCIKLVAKGYYAKQVADELCLSRRTVEKYLELAKEKWQCSTLNELAYLYGLSC